MAGIIAALTVAPGSDWIGRKKMLLILSALYSLSAVASAIAPHYEALVAARFIDGLAFGSLMMAPIYIAEVAPPESRGGWFPSINSTSLWILPRRTSPTISCCKPVEPKPAGHKRSAWMLGIEAVPALLGIPESPRWLQLKHGLEDARSVLVRFVPETRINAMLREIQDTIPTATPPWGQRLREFGSPQLRFVLGIGLIIGIVLQGAGVNAICFYAPTIFEQIGVGTNAAFAQAVMVGIVNVVFTVVAMALIDWLGREPLLVAGLVGILLSMTLAGCGFSQATYQLTAADLPNEALAPVLGIVYSDDLSFRAALSGAIGLDTLRTNETALIQAAIHINATLVLLLSASPQAADEHGWPSRANRHGSIATPGSIVADSPDGAAVARPCCRWAS